MSLATSIAYTAAVTVYIFYLYVTTGATGTVQVSWSGAHTLAGSVSTVQGLAPLAPDQVAAGGSGTSTAPSSGATPTTTQAVEIAWGVIANTGASIGGSWSNSFTDNQTVNINGNNTVDDGYLILSSTGAQTAAKTAITSSTWGAVCATFKGVGHSPSLINTQAVNRTSQY